MNIVAISVFNTSDCLLFNKQPATTLRAKEIQRTIFLFSAIFSDNVMLKIFSCVVIGFFVTRSCHGLIYTGVLSKDIQYYAVLNFLLQANERKNV